MSYQLLGELLPLLEAFEASRRAGPTAEAADAQAAGPVGVAVAVPAAEPTAGPAVPAAVAAGAPAAGLNAVPATALAVPPDGPLLAFAEWLPRHLAAAAAAAPPAAAAAPAAAPTPAPPAYEAARVAPHPAETPASLLSKLVTFLYRYVRGYSRLALADTPLAGFDDFLYLLTVHYSPPGTKSELMARNIHEKATGTEIIKRLLGSGLLKEGPHPSDRRSKLLHPTPLGRGLLLALLPRMGQVAQLGAGNLTAAEQEQLVHLLHKLEAFHHRLFVGPRPADFDAFMAAQGIAPPAVPGG